MHGQVVALLVARPGRIREAWRALLLSTSAISTVREAGDATGALTALDTYGPDIVLLDAEALGVEALALVDQIRAIAPACPCIVLVQDERQARELRGLGVAEVLIKGLPAAQLFETVERVLALPANTSDEFKLA
jgi:DNA-binding NarL/FixJ family response regulator